MSAWGLSGEGRLQDEIHARTAHVAIVTKGVSTPTGVLFCDAQLLLNLGQDLATARVQNPGGDGVAFDSRATEHVVEHRCHMLPGNRRNVRR